MNDILDDFRKNQEPDILDLARQQKSDQKLATINQLRETGTPTGAFFADMGATLNKVIPNLKRLVDADDKEAIAEIKKIEEFQDILRTAFPSAVFGGEVGAPAAAGVAAMATGGGVPAAMAVGAVEGSMFSGSEDNPRTNALIGGALPVAPEFAKKGIDTLMDIGQRVTTRAGDIVQATPEQQAGRAIKRFSDYAGIDPEQALTARQQMGSEATLADTDEMYGLAQGLAIQPSGKQYMQAFEERQLGQSDRIAGMFAEATGKTADDFVGDFAEYTANRAQRAGPAYQEAFDMPLEMTEDLGFIVKRLENSGAFNKAKEISGITGKELDLENLNFSTLHSAKVALDDIMLKERRKSGISNKYRALTKLKEDLLNSIESQNPAYKAARIQFSSDSSLINAMELGADLFNPKIRGEKVTFDELKNYVNKMSADEFTAFQGGVAKAIDEKLAKIPNTSDSAKKMWSTRYMRDRLAVAFPTQQEFDKFLSGLETETSFTDTLRTLYQGSQTADKLASAEALRTQDLNLMEPIKQLIRGDLTPDAYLELSRLMFDKNVPNDEIRRVLIQAGIINESATSKKIKSIRDNWDKMFKRINISAITPQQRAAFAPVVSEMNSEDQINAKNN